MHALDLIAAIPRRKARVRSRSMQRQLASQVSSNEGTIFAVAANEAGNLILSRVSSSNPSLVAGNLADGPELPHPNLSTHMTSPTNSPDSAFRTSLEKLHARLRDVIHGYQEALDHAEPDVTPSLLQMQVLHQEDADDLRNHLAQIQGDASKEGSWMTPVQEAVMEVRAWLTGIDKNVLPAVVRGERSLLELYDDAIEEAPGPSTVLNTLSSQRTVLRERIDILEARQH